MTLALLQYEHVQNMMIWDREGDNFSKNCNMKYIFRTVVCKYCEYENNNSSGNISNEFNGVPNRIVREIFKGVKDKVYLLTRLNRLTSRSIYNLARVKWEKNQI